ncbi:hypothetical protein [Candidatus Frankia nodulisporulans]|uniref:hypothetical protein n=1 Tax=Candidatus Frankia nodulisporulans TaxID=2060052 RepID=UPI0013D0C51B|nr:hypothetical protein [Candidatus Frankia nodulisporulans]
MIAAAGPVLRRGLQASPRNTAEGSGTGAAGPLDVAAPGPAAPDDPPPAAAGEPPAADGDAPPPAGASGAALAWGVAGPGEPSTPLVLVPPTSAPWVPLAPSGAVLMVAPAWSEPSAADVPGPVGSGVDPAGPGETPAPAAAREPAAASSTEDAPSEHPTSATKSNPVVTTVTARRARACTAHTANLPSQVGSGLLPRIGTG